jgi:hypothetical protein
MTTFRLTVSHVLVVFVLSLSAISSFGHAFAQDSGATPTTLAAMSADEAVAAAMVEDGVLRFDVSENATRFVFDPDLVFDDGMPAYGATFITRAYIYPAGTLDESNGVNADGSPEFPDQVLGQWICRGWFVGEGMRTMSGAMLVTHQIYNFGDGLGQAMLTSDGYELADVGVQIDRAITGGTGPFAGAGGVAHQTLLGLNAAEGVNLHFEIELTATAA